MVVGVTTPQRRLYSRLSWNKVCWPGVVYKQTPRLTGWPGCFTLTARPAPTHSTMPLFFHSRRSKPIRRGLWLLMWMLALHAMPPIGWLPLDGAPWVGQARADDGDDGGDGDDGSDGDGGSASSAGSDSGTGGQDTDPGPPEPELPVQADGFSATELIALDPSPAALQRAAQWGARVVETSVQAGLGVRVVRLQLPPGIDARTALAVTNERDPGVFDLHHFYQLAQAEAAACEGASCEPMQRMAWPALNARCGRDQTIGMVDSGVSTGLPALRLSLIHI